MPTEINLENLKVAACDFACIGRGPAEKIHGCLLDWYEELGREIVRDAITEAVNEKRPVDERPVKKLSIKKLSIK